MRVSINAPHVCNIVLFEDEKNSFSHFCNKLILSNFVQATSELALELCTKEQLIEIAEHYQIEKKNLKRLLKLD